METSAWHSLTVEQTLQQLGTTLEGWSTTDVQRSRQTYGSNALPLAAPPSGWVLFLQQFRSALIYILIIAALISFWLKEWQDGWAILGVVVLNAIIGWRQESQANQAMAKLLALSPPAAHVIRGGMEQEVSVDQVVVGDVMVLGTGDSVPADGRWIEALNVRANESTLTGESVPVSKITDPLEQQTAIQERHNLGWRGTLIVAGRGKILVTATGPRTRFGSIVVTTQSVHNTASPFQQKLNNFSRTIAWITLLIGLGIFGLGILRDLPVHQVFLLAVSIIVSIVPEGLPVVITVAMTWGMWAMAKRQAVVRKLSAVEALGAVTVVATDKTGTLTYGEMMTTRLWVDGQTYHFTGRGYAPEGDILVNDQKVLGREHEGLSLGLRLGAMNNDSRFSLDEQGQRLAIGDPTELALVVAAGKAGWSKLDLDMVHPRLGEFPFSFQKKYMVTWHRQKPGQVMVVLKGAPHEVLRLCHYRWSAGQPMAIKDADRARVMELYEQWANDALRGLAVAYCQVPEQGPVTDLEHGQYPLIFVGLFGLEDALRPEAGQALQTIQQAGIRTLMVTGDYAKTGLAVAARLGLNAGKPGTLLDGGEVDGLSDTQLSARLHQARVATRLTPEHKLRIARLLKQQGEVVAMTGDGINDVPAIVEADIGIAVGRQSSDAAKEAADMVLVDGNFQSIVAAVAEGRRMFRNIRRVMLYLLASNFGELLLIVMTLLIGLPLPLLPTQIIWLNAVTDPFLGLALAREPISPTAMIEQPRPRHEAIITPTVWRRVLLNASAIAFGSLLVFLYALSSDRSQPEIYALVMTSVAFGEWFCAFTSRSSHRSLLSRFGSNRALYSAFLMVIALQAAVLYIPALAQAFHVAPLVVTDWLIAIGGGSAVLLIEEIRKVFIRRQYRVTQVAAAHS